MHGARSISVELASQLCQARFSRKSSRRVHDGQDDERTRTHLIHDPVRRIDDLSQSRIIEFRDGTTRERIPCEVLDGGEKTLGDDARVPRGICGDIVANLRDIRDRRSRPDYLHP